MGDAKQREIVADQRHHRLDRLAAHDRQPLRLAHVAKRGAVLRGQRRADRLQVVARIKSVGDRTDVLAERLAVAQMHRAGEHIDLGAGIVDVVLARDVVAGEGQQRGERVAEHGAARVTDVHGAGRIGGNILDVDALAAADGAAAVGVAGRDERGENRMPRRWLETQVDEARPGDFDSRHVGVVAQHNRYRLSELARVVAQRLGQNQRGVGRQIAVPGIAWRLDHDPPKKRRNVVRASGIGPRGQDTLGCGADTHREVIENVHRFWMSHPPAGAA